MPCLKIGIITISMNKKTFLTGKTILITGGAGFIGSHLLDEVLLSNPKKVYVLDDFSSSTRDNIEDQLKNKNVALVCSSVLDKETIYDLVKNSSIIFHLAASNVGLSLVDPEKNMLVNVCGTVNLLEAIKDAGGDKLLLHVSSGSVVNPWTPYAISKRAGEDLALFYGKEMGLKVAVVRPHHVYGPRQDAYGKSGVINIFLRTAITHGFVEVWGDGSQVKNFTNVKDIVSGIITVCEKLYDGNSVDNRVFDIASDKKMTIEDLAYDVKKLLDCFPVEIRHAKEKVGENKELFPDTSNIKELGWKESVNFVDGLFDCVNYVSKKIKINYVPRDEDGHHSPDLQ